MPDDIAALSILTFALGLLVGLAGPPLIAWVLTRNERPRRATVDDLLEGIGVPQQKHGRRRK